MNVLNSYGIRTSFDVLMSNDDLNQLKKLADDLEVALAHMKNDGYSDENIGFIWLACAIDDLRGFIDQRERDKKEFISRMERDQTPRPVIVFRRQSN